MSTDDRPMTDLLAEAFADGQQVLEAIRAGIDLTGLAPEQAYALGGLKDLIMQSVDPSA